MNEGRRGGSAVGVGPTRVARVFDVTEEDADAVHASLAKLDWDFSDARTTDSVHGLYSYPAKFIPDIPATLIRTLSRPGDLILDPFVGGGTTAIEALRTGRRFFGLDANPIAVHLARVRATPLTASDDREIQRLLLTLEQGPLPMRKGSDWAPSIPNCNRWYAPEIFDLLTALRREIVCLTSSQQARDLALFVFTNVAAKASFQESETRYVSKPRPIFATAVLASFTSELRTATRLMRDAQWTQRATIIDADARDVDAYPDEVALAVTSPPYPNAFDYHLYHRFRLFWLGPGPQSLREREIGSHLKHQSESSPAGSYLADMRSVLRNVHKSLRAGGWFALVVGDGLYKGQVFSTARELSAVAEDAGFEALPPIDRNLPRSRRSVTAAGRRLQQEQILLLRKPLGSSGLVRMLPPNYRLFPYEEALRVRELQVLGGSAPVQDEGTSVLKMRTQGASAMALRRAAFSHSLEFPGAPEVPTHAGLLEGVREGRRKNSAYATHGIHRYKGKFYPQLAKALINSSELAENARVVDPFGGSGTVTVEAILAGYEATSIDCNPVATAIAAAKTDGLAIPRPDLEEFLRELLQVASSPDRNDRRVQDLSAFSEQVLPELLSWFPLPVLVKLQRLLSFIRQHHDPRVVNLGSVIVSDLIREVSQQDPKDLRIRRRAVPIENAPVGDLLRERVEQLLQRMDRYWAAQPHLPRLGHATLVRGNSTEASAYPTEMVDALISSPPYASALPYIDTDRLSLAAVFGRTVADRRLLEAEMVGSRDIREKDKNTLEHLLEEPDSLDLPASTVAWLIGFLEAVQSDRDAGFRRRQAPAVLTRYFIAMSSVLRASRGYLKEGSHVWLVLGDSHSTIAGRRWTIPTINEVLAIAKHHGYEWVETLPITVTREDSLHSRHAIVDNDILHLRRAHQP